MSDDTGIEEELIEHTHRLEELEDRLNVTFPTPDAPMGAAQRVRLEVPTPASVMTLGARGTAASDGKPIGPGGFALRTVENLGAEVLGNAIIDSAGLTILHADAPARMLTLADLGISARHEVRVGTDDGNIEVTAGDVRYEDPSFTVVPSMSVPGAPEIDTASPRQSVEQAQAIWSGIWAAIGGYHGALGAAGLLSMFTSWIDPPGGRSAPSVESRVGRKIEFTVGVLGMLRSMIVPAVEAAEAASAEAHEEPPPEGSQVRVHGRGGVHLTSPLHVTAFGGRKASLDSPIKAQVRGGLAADLKSTVAAKVYGGMVAALKSDLVAKVSGRYVAISGKFAEVRAESGASLTSKEKTVVSSDSDVVLDATNVTIGGAAAVDVSTGNRIEITSRRTIQLEARQRAQTKVDRSEVTLDPEGVGIAHGGVRVDVSQDGIRLQPSGGMFLHVDRNSVRFANIGRLQRGEVTLRGRCNFG